MNAKQLNELWGDELFIFFADDFNEDGWLTNEWCNIVDDRLPPYTLNESQESKSKDIYTRMYLTEFEESECGKFIKPKEGSFN